MYQKTTLSEFPATITIPVQWGEMDAAQHVNNVTYLRWVESARVDYFFALDSDVVPDKGEAGFILGWQDCKYIFPVTYPDTVHLGTRTIEMGTDRFMLETHIFSERHDRLVAISKQLVVMYDYENLKKTEMPDELRERIKQLEGKNI